MSFTETLFGGLLAIVLLYFVGRRLKLSNYWSALLSGAIPLLSYVVYSLTHGVEGDVLAIHMAVFMATAGVLGVFGGLQRNSQQKMHWAPKLLIAFFALLVVFNAALLSISMHGLPDSVFGTFLPKPDKPVTVHTGFPGAVPHDRNKLYEPHLQRIEQQRNLGWKLTFTGLDALKKNVPSEVVLKVSDKDGQPLGDAKIFLSLWRMANSADDRRLQLVDQGQGKYATRLELASAGKWIAEIFIERGQDSYLMQQAVVIAE